MRKIDTNPYMIEVTNPETGEVTSVPYKAKESMAAMLFHPELKLGGREIIQRDKIAEKIEKSEGEVLLEEVDYSKLKEAFETVKGFGRNDLELVKRVLDAPMVDVEEKKEE